VYENTNIGGTLSVPTVLVTGTTESTSYSTGAAIVGGGMGIPGNIYTSGGVFVNNTTDSTSASTGAVIIPGGVAIQKSLTTVGNVKQGGTLNTNIMFYATYYESIYGSYGGGNLTPTIVVGSTVRSFGIYPMINTNRLVTGNGAYYVSYSATSNADFTSLGAVRLMYTPNYSGTPATNMGIVSIGTYGGSENCLSFYHGTSGDLVLDYYDSAGDIVANVTKAWSPTSGTEYELAFLCDMTGNSKIYINGVATSGPPVVTLRTTVTTLQVGSDVASCTYTSNCKIRNLVVYNNNPFGAGSYTPGYTLPNGYAFNTGAVAIGSALSAYTEYLLTTRFTGPFTTDFVTIRFILLNNTVFMYCGGVTPAASGSNTPFTATSTVPIGFRPQENIDSYVCVYNINTYDWGLCIITNTGIIYIWWHAAGFSPTGSCGWKSFSAKYVIA
jgi:hypothetical protein